MNIASPTISVSLFVAVAKKKKKKDRMVLTEKRGAKPHRNSISHLPLLQSARISTSPS